MAGRPRLTARVVAVAVVALAVLAGGCSRDKPKTAGSTTTSSSAPGSTTSTLVERPRGGSVRVAVWGMPDPSAPTLIGAAVRSLVLPQLFALSPSGDRVPSLVEPGSDATNFDRMSASFRLRPGAKWSNGAPITVEDLRRSADPVLVASVDGPEADGYIYVRFKQPLEGWRRLWSDTASISPPAPGVWGGPFVVASVTPGLETVLRRNDSWWGAPEPWLDEVRLVLVPEATMQRQLFERGELDVVSPLAYTNRTAQFPGALRGGVGGWDVRLVVNDQKANPPTAAALLGAADIASFVGTLLKDEADLGAGVAGRAGPVEPLKGKTVQLTGEVEEPMTATLQRSMQKRVVAAGGVLELRNAESERVEAWVAAGDYEAALLVGWEPPEPCSACPKQGAVEKLWSPRVLVAVGPGVQGVDVNPWALSPAWDAASWWRPSGGTS